MRFFKFQNAKAVTHAIAYIILDTHTPKNDHHTLVKVVCKCVALFICDTWNRRFEECFFLVNGADPMNIYIYTH